MTIARYLATSSLVAALALAPLAAAPARAQDARDVIGGALIGGVIGYAIGQSQAPRGQAVQPGRPAQPGAGYQPPRPGIPATEAGRQVQTALNYFGYAAGTVDGQVGPATRAAIERYQATMGYPVTGTLTEAQAEYLLGGYSWASNGGQGQTGLSGPALLLAYGEVLDGTGAVQYGGQPGQGGPAGTVIVAPPASATPVTAAGSGTGAVPNLFAAAGAPTLSRHCGEVALQGQANGGMMTLANLADPGFALSEQFCTARASAIAQGADLTAAIPGLTEAQIAGECTAFSGAVAGQTGLIGVTAPDEAIASAQAFVGGSGVAQPELAATARVCLGVGYAADDMAMALGSALILVAADEPAYGELIAHHLREGFGVAADGARAHAWYQTTLAALAAGAPAVFGPTDAGRVPLIRQAVAITLAPQVQPVPVPVPVVVPAPPPVVVPAPATIIQPAPAPVPSTVVLPAPGQVGVQPQIIPSVTPAPQPTGGEVVIRPLTVNQ